MKTEPIPPSPIRSSTLYRPTTERPGPTTDDSMSAVGGGAASGPSDAPTSAWAASSRATRSASAAAPQPDRATEANRSGGAARPMAWWKTDSTSLGSGGMAALRGRVGPFNAPFAGDAPHAGRKKSGPVGGVTEAVVQPGPGVGPPP